MAIVELEKRSRGIMFSGNCLRLLFLLKRFQVYTLSDDEKKRKEALFWSLMFLAIGVMTFMAEVTQVQLTRCGLNPSIKLQILLLCFHIFLTEVVGRSC